MHPTFIAALFTIAKIWKQSKCLLTDEGIKKMWYIYTMENYSAIKKNEIMPFASTWMDLEMIIPSEISQKEKDKYMVSLTSGIFLKKPHLQKQKVERWFARVWGLGEIGRGW